MLHGVLGIEYSILELGTQKEPTLHGAFGIDFHKPYLLNGLDLG